MNLGLLTGKGVYTDKKNSSWVTENDKQEANFM
jgi:hypothetical protein